MATDSGSGSDRDKILISQDVGSGNELFFGLRRAFFLVKRVPGRLKLAPVDGART